MKKTLIGLVMVMSICMSSIISVGATTQASGDSDNPTELSLNTYYDSYMSATHTADYYTFTLSTKKKVLIECDDVPSNRQYKMTLSGNNIEPIYTTDSTQDNHMYIVADLNVGTYYLKLEGDFNTNTSTDDAYRIIVSNEIIDRGYTKNSADHVFVDDDFEDSDVSNWLDIARPHYVYGNKTIESDTNGNYIAFTSATSGQYYGFEAKDVYSTSVLCSEFDIKFTSGNMEIQVRQADSNLDTNFKMAGRIRKFAYYLQYYSDGEWKYMLNTSGGWLQLNNVDKWYTIRMTLDVRTNKYSIYLEDRDNGNVISKAESVSFAEECTHISFYAFSSLDKLCIDNVKIFETSAGVKINGWTYIKVPQEGTRQYNYFNILPESNKTWSSDQWTLLNNVSGVSVDKNTGILSISSDARPGSLIICASKKYYPWVRSTFLVDIDRR